MPSFISSRARDLPKRPSPMTATGGCGALLCLANEGPSFREGVATVPLAQREGRHQRDRTEPSDEHEHHQDS